MTDAATPATTDAMPRALPAELSIYSAADTHAHMLRWLDADRDTRVWPVQAGDVAQADAAGVQLLLSLSHSLHARGQQLHLVTASDALQQACRRLGLSQRLSQWLDA